MNKNSLGKAAQAWCYPATEHLVMISELAVVFADILDAAVLAEREACIAEVDATITRAFASRLSLNETRDMILGNLLARRDKEK